MSDQNRMAVSIADAMVMSSLGRSSLYKAIANGKLKIRKAGRRTLIETASLRQFIEALPESGGNQNVA